MPRGPAAFEPAIDNTAISVRALTDIVDSLLKSLVASAPAICSNAEVWQLSFKQKGFSALDGVTIIYNGDAVKGFQSRNLSAERGVVGRVKINEPPLYLSRAWLEPCSVERLSIKIDCRAESCRILAGIKALTRRIAIWIYNVTVESRADLGRVWEEVCIESIDMPVRIFERLAQRVEAFEYIFRNKCPSMRHRQDQGAWAAYDV
jgi:hypothetical protein